MSKANLRELLTALRDNLISQRQVMLADDLAALAELTKTQQTILESLHLDNLIEDLRGEGNDIERELVQEIMDLLQTNELLARQSLSFARRMLGALNTGEKTLTGQIPAGLGLDRKV